MIENENPYESPIAEPEPKPKRPQKFRWRVIPAAALIIWGFFHLFAYGYCIWIRETTPDHRYYTYYEDFYGAHVLYIVIGCEWIAAGICAWMRQWILVGIAVALALAMPMLFPW